MKKDQLESLCKEIIEKLSVDAEQGVFPSRSFYGETFFALSLALYDKNKYEKMIIKMLDAYQQKDVEDSEFHWEFNNYALAKLVKIDKKYERYLHRPLRFRNSQVTNWTLMRGVVKAENGEADDEFRKKLCEMQKTNGFIKDDYDVASFQYHAFSTAMIYEMYLLTKDVFYLNSFLKAVEFISKFTLENGISLYVGRGQEQIFGYGTLLYIYEMAYRETGRVEFKNVQKKAFCHVEETVRENNKFTLVVNLCEEESERNLDINDKRHLGWYQYNNFYDYLPFLLYYLVLTFKSFQENAVDTTEKKIKVYCDDKYFRYIGDKYDCALACEKGSWTNALIFPLIISEGKTITPCYGGEQFDCVLYDVTGIPVPYGKSKISPYRSMKEFIKSVYNLLTKQSKVFSLWDYGEYFFSYDHKILKIENESKFLIHIRSMSFEENEIVVEETFEFKHKCYFDEFYFVNLHFLEICEIKEKQIYGIGYGNSIVFHEPLCNLEVNSQYNSAIGPLYTITDKKQNLRIRKNEVIKYNYKVIMDKRYERNN